MPHPQVMSPVITKLCKSEEEPSSGFIFPAGEFTVTWLHPCCSHTLMWAVDIPCPLNHSQDLFWHSDLVDGLDFFFNTPPRYALELFWAMFFSFSFLFCIGVRPISSVVIVLGEQKSDVPICIPGSILPQTPLTSRLPHSTEQSSLCCE